MTPEIEKATENLIKLTHEFNEADQNLQQILEKLGNNHEYAQAQQAVNKLGEQLDKLLTQKNKLNDRILFARLKAQRIREKIETQFEYKTACNYRDETRNKCWEAQDYLHQLIAKEAENDARQH